MYMQYNTLACLHGCNGNATMHFVCVCVYVVLSYTLQSALQI